MDKIDSVLAVNQQPVAAAVPMATGAPADAGQLCKELDAARKAKDFPAADRLRKQLQEAGFEVMTTKAGTTARRKLA
jgi:cysteinyl-tRNA synthetase